MTEATRAREKANLSIEAAAKALRVEVAYLRQREKDGFTYPLAQRAAALYRCDLRQFLKKREETRKVSRKSVHPKANNLAVLANPRSS